MSECTLSKEDLESLAKILLSKLNIALMALTAITMACGPASEQNQPVTTPDSNSTIKVSMRNFEYMPARIMIDSGSNVSFVLTSTDILHSFTVNELGVNWMVDGNQDPQIQTVSFKRPGIYQIICVIPGHQQSGMVGTLTVR